MVPWLQQGRERRGHAVRPGMDTGQGLGTAAVSPGTVASAKGPWAPNARITSVDMRPSHDAGEGGHDLKETVYILIYSSPCSGTFFHPPDHHAGATSVRPANSTEVMPS